MGRFYSCGIKGSPREVLGTVLHDGAFLFTLDWFGVLPGRAGVGLARPMAPSYGRVNLG